MTKPHGPKLMQDRNIRHELTSLRPVADATLLAAEIMAYLERDIAAHGGKGRRLGKIALEVYPQAMGNSGKHKHAFSKALKECERRGCTIEELLAGWLYLMPPVFTDTGRETGDE